MHGFSFQFEYEVLAMHGLNFQKPFKNVYVEATMKRFYRNKLTVGLYDDLRFFSSGGKFVSFKELDATLGLLGHYKTLLEIGCGTGRLTRHLVNRCDKLMCMDSSFEMIRRTRQAHPDVLFIQGTADNIPIKQNKLDACVSLRVFIHFNAEKLDTIIRELARCLKERGELIFETHNRCSLNLIIIVANISSYLTELFSPNYFIKNSKVQRIIEDNGFYVISRKSIFFIPSFLFLYGCIFLPFFDWLNRKLEKGFPDFCSDSFWKIKK